MKVSVKPDLLSPFLTLCGGAPFPRFLPFFKPGFHHVKRALESEPKKQACFFLSSGSNHPRGASCVLLPTVHQRRHLEAPSGSLGCIIAWGMRPGTPHHLRRDSRRCIYRRKTGRYGMSRHWFGQGPRRGLHSRYRIRRGRHCGRQDRRMAAKTYLGPAKTSPVWTLRTS